MQGENNGEEENRVMKTGDTAAVFHCTFGAFPKSIFYILYTISKLRKSRIQRFKPCTIWSLNEEDMAFGRQLHQVEGQIRTMESKVRIPQSKAWEFRTPQTKVRNCNSNVRKLDIFADFFSSDIFVSKFPFSHCIQPLM